MPKISVIMPVYNVEKYLRSTLDSVFNQTFKNFEIICVNDGSTDGSGKILQEYMTNPKPGRPRMRVIYQANQGPSVARNSGMEEAQGDYIFFMDSDDLIHPQCLEIMHYLSEKHKVKLLCCEHYKEEFPGQYTLDGHKIYDNKDSIHVIETDNPLKFFDPESKPRLYYTPTFKLFKRSMLKDLKFVPGMYFEDLPFIATLLKQKPKTLMVPEPLYYYRKNTESITNKGFTEKHLRSYHQALNIIKEEYMQPDTMKEWNFLLKHLYPYVLGRIVYKIGNCNSETKQELLPIWRGMLSDLVKSKCISWGQEVVKPKKRFLPYIFTAKHHKRILPQLERTLYESSRKRLTLSRV